MIYLKVVIVGTTFGNKTVHGPFDDDEHMNQWIAIHVGNQPYETVDPTESMATSCGGRSASRPGSP